MSSASVIFLIGPMGAGKTTIGKGLANLLGLNFYDADEMLEQMHQASIAQIFQTHGEAYFRQQETKLLRNIISKSKIVYATGGGCILSHENRQLMREHGLVCYLTVSPEQQILRLMNIDSRPLLPIDLTQRAAFLHAMMSRRAPLYHSVADIFINTDRVSENVIIADLVDQLKGCLVE